MTATMILRGAWYHLNLPVRMAWWRWKAINLIHQGAWRPCVTMPDDIVCALYRQQLWTSPRRFTLDEGAVRSSIAFEIIERVHEGSSFVREFLDANELQILWPRDAVAS